MGDKRREKRTPRKILARILEAEGTFPAIVRNMSGHGMQIGTTRDLAAGRKVKMLLQPDSASPIPVEGQIRWHRGESGGESVELGLQLDSAPPGFFDLLLSLPAGGLAEQLHNLSAMPLVILDLMAMVNDPASSVRHIEEKIKTDQALVAYLLKSVNSPFYGLAKPATSIRQTIQVTGFAALRSLLLSYFTRQLTYLAGDRETQQRLWQHALGVALTAREMAKSAGLDGEEAYTAGLLHDIGKAVLLTADTATYLPVLRETFAASEPSLHIEGRLLGYSHVEAGLYVMERWNFSQLQRDVVAFHHSPQAYGGGHATVPIAAFANQLLHRQGGRESSAAEPCPLPPELQHISTAGLMEKALEQMQSLC